MHENKLKAKDGWLIYIKVRDLSETMTRLGIRL